MIVPLGRSLTADELPVLGSHDLSMWAYIVLTALARADAPSQGVLAGRIGADKTRIIAVLDDLQARSLIERNADPVDRRAYTLSLTTAGRRLHAAAQADIRRGEESLLAVLPAPDRAVFLRCLQKLTRDGAGTAG